MKDDLISRQAALDVMETWDKFGCDPDGKLVRYDDDKHYIPYVHYEDMVHAIKHLPSAQQWIPCSERMPFVDEYGKSDQVLATCGLQGAETSSIRWLRILYFNGCNWCFPTGESYEQMVYAWMPLPKPAKIEV